MRNVPGQFEAYNTKIIKIMRIFVHLFLQNPFKFWPEKLSDKSNDFRGLYQEYDFFDKVLISALLLSVF